MALRSFRRFGGPWGPPLAAAGRSFNRRDTLFLWGFAMQTVPKYAGFFWYRADQYERLKKVSKDHHKMPDTHAHFVQFAEQGMKEARLRGWVPVKIDVDIDVYLAWCRAAGHDVDAQSRVAYVNERVAEMIRSGALAV